MEPSPVSSSSKIESISGQLATKNSMSF